MGVVLQLVCRILSPLVLAVRSLLSSCEAGKLRKSLKEHREKYIFKHSGSYSLLQSKADCSLNFLETDVLSSSLSRFVYYYYYDDGDDDDYYYYFCCCYFQNKQSPQEI